MKDHFQSLSSPPPSLFFILIPLWLRNIPTLDLTFSKYQEIRGKEKKKRLKLFNPILELTDTLRRLGVSLTKVSA